MFCENLSTYITEGGSLYDHHEVSFDDRAEAQAYADKLWDAIEKDNPRYGDLRKIVRCTTEALPAMVFPSKRPDYC